MDIDLFTEFSSRHRLSPVTPLDLSGKDLAGFTPANRDNPKYFGYIYEVICDVDMKNYVGKHKSVRSRKAAVVDRYMGSGGPYYKNALLKHGLEHFHKFYLDVVLYDSNKTDAEMARELCDKEIAWISKRNHCDRSIGYNLKEGGNGDWSIVSEGNVGRVFVSKGDEQHLITPGALQYYLDRGFVRGLSEKTKACMKENSGIRGKHRSAATRALISKNSKGKNLGKKRTDELRARQSAMRLGKVWVNDGNSEKWLSPDEAMSYQANGWVEGRLLASEETKRKMTEARKGRVWVHLGPDQRFVNKDEADQLMTLGYVAGRGSRTKRVD